MTTVLRPPRLFLPKGLTPAARVVRVPPTAGAQDPAALVVSAAATKKTSTKHAPPTFTSPFPVDAKKIAMTGPASASILTPHQSISPVVLAEVRFKIEIQVEAEAEAKPAAGADYVYLHPT